MNDLTYADIQKMSDEEVSELNRKLGKEVMKKFVIFHLAKWALIFGATALAKKWLEAKQEN